MTTTFLLVRHAACALMDSVLLGRALDSPLSPLGELQSQALAERLADCRDLVVEASPRRRTQQTAAAIALRHGCTVFTAADLDEVDFGAWAGTTFAELARDRHWQSWNEQRSRTCTPAGDSILQVQHRLQRHLRKLQDAFPGCTLVVVTHAEIIRSMVLRCRQMPIDAYNRIEISPASVTTLLMTNSRMQIAGVNERVAA